MKARGPWGNWLVNDKWKDRRKPASERIEGEACQPQATRGGFHSSSSGGEKKYSDLERRDAEKAFAADVHRLLSQAVNRCPPSHRLLLSQVVKP